MPLYEYQCDACGARFERIRKFSDPPLTTCPTCGKEEVRKLISSPAFQFKGSGWYITDYARKAEGGESKGESPKDAAGAKAEGGDAAKPAEKPAEKAAETPADKPADKPAAKPADKPA